VLIENHFQLYNNRFFFLGQEEYLEPLLTTNIQPAYFCLKVYSYSL